MPKEKNFLKKADFVTEIAKRTRLKKSDVRLVVDSMAETLAKGLAKDGVFSVPKFCTFRVASITPHTHCTPATGYYKAKTFYRILFRWSDHFKERINPKRLRKSK